MDSGASDLSYIAGHSSLIADSYGCDIFTQPPAMSDRNNTIDL